MNVPKFLIKIKMNVVDEQIRAFLPAGGSAMIHQVGSQFRSSERANQMEESFMRNLECIVEGGPDESISPIIRTNAS
jgi:hypothetical protein